MISFEVYSVVVNEVEFGEFKSSNLFIRDMQNNGMVLIQNVSKGYEACVEVFEKTTRVHVLVLHPKLPQCFFHNHWQTNQADGEGFYSVQTMESVNSDFLKSS